MRRTLIHIASLAVAVGSVTLAACGSDSNSPSQLPDATLSMQDQCDSASFNAGIGAGTCTHQGSVTLAQFNSELTATQKVAAWAFAPTALTIQVGQSIKAMNDGGEGHTFTEVEAFGGGIIPALNTASGNPVEAPECAALATNALVAPGGTFTSDAATTVGTEYYQCCIHPWMRATVTITGT
ncbi:MAG TPA: hypothetical protein VK636_09010 [Gemmatimonadaceae bacterium]|nr:hypothetical protein [Gemmatimonadaceae bacterium]